MARIINPPSPIFCAIDTIDLDKAKEIARDLGTLVRGIKIGIEFFSAHGPAGVCEVVGDNQELFLDLKLHDIPTTVANAIKAMLHLEPHFITVHSQEAAMLRAAVKAADTADKQRPPWRRPAILGVTVLTSTPAHAGLVNERAMLARDCGLDGVVCAASEVARLRMLIKPPFLYVVPGIRPDDWVRDDHQAQAATPRAALNAGADYLVIGRPITQAVNARRAVQEIIASLREAPV